jgi:hypothetical protein
VSSARGRHYAGGRNEFDKANNFRTRVQSASLCLRKKKNYILHKIADGREKLDILRKTRIVEANVHDL